MGTPGNATLISDAVLLEQYARTRDAEAFAELVRRHAGFVYGTALRVTRNADDAEDVAQECFLELARKAGAITSSLAGWLHKAAMHRSANAVRRLSRRRRHERRAAMERYDEVEPTWNDIAPHVDKALGRLPEELRVPIILHYFGGQSQSQIASELSVSQPTVSRRLEKGVAELRRRLKAAGIVPSVAVLMALLAENAATAAPDTLMISLGKMAIAGAGKGGSAAGAASCAGSAEGSSAFPTTLVGTPGGKIALVVAAGAVVLVGAMAVRHEPIPTPHAPAAHTPVRALAAANREMTNVSPGGRRAGGGRTPTRDAKRGETVRVQAAPPDVPAGGFGMWGAASPKAVAPGDVVIQALTAKAAAVRDYHYRLEWTMAGGTHWQTDEVWYAGPNRMRIPQRDALREIVINGDDEYTVDLRNCGVTRSRAPEAEARLEGSRGDTMGPVFLSREVLALWPRVEAKGTETVGGVPCRVVELSSTDRKLWGMLEQEEDDFVAFIPHTHTGDRMSYRFWVDGDAGIVRRWEEVSFGRAWRRVQVMETLEVNGRSFPAVVRLDASGNAYIGRITEAAVNQGVEQALAGFPPHNWLVKDGTLSLEQTQERLQADPDDAGLHYTLGHLYENGQRRDEAIKEFRRAAELAPDSPSPLFALGLALQQGPAQSREEAVEAFRRGIARAGQDSSCARLTLAQALREAGKTDEAITEYRQLTAAGSPVLYRALCELTNTLAGKGDFEGAYRAACDIPLGGLGRWGLHVLSIFDWAGKSDHLDDLRTKAEQALATDPDSNVIRLLLGRVRHAQGDRAGALETIKPVGLPFASPEAPALAEIVSLARDLEAEEWLARARRALTRDAVNRGNTALLGWAFPPGELQDAVAGELIGEAAALWTEAADRHARAGILDDVVNVAIYGEDGGRGTILAREPAEMTPGECAVVGTLAARLAEVHGDAQTVGTARRHAEQCYLRALDKWRDDAALWAKLGILQWSAEDWQGAAEAYRKAAAAQADEIEYPARVAFVLVRLGRCEDAIAAGRKAIEPWGDEPAGKAFLASLEMDCRHFDAARDTLATVYDALGVDGSQIQKTSVGRMLAQCHERLGEIDEAEAVLKQLLEGPEGWDRSLAYDSLCQFYARHGRRDDAYAAAKASHVLKKSWPGLQFDSIWMVERVLGDDPGALAAAVRADLEAHPEDADTVAFAAAIYDSMRRDADALPLLLQMAEKTNDADAWIRLADTAARAKDGEVLVKALWRALDLRPDDTELQSRYARAAATQGDLGTAKALADELRAKAGKLPQSWREVADLYLTAESWDDALAAAERVLALTPETDEPAQMRAQILAAQAYVGKRDDHEARRRLIPILAQSNDPSVLREAAEALVDLYLLREEREQAIATLNDLRLRTQDRGLLDWIDQRLKEIAGD